MSDEIVTVGTVTVSGSANGIDDKGNLVAFTLVDHKPSEAEIAADLKRRISEAMQPVLEMFDEANRAGFLVRWDGVGPAPPLFKNQVLGLRLEKHY